MYSPLRPLPTREDRMGAQFSLTTPGWPALAAPGYGGTGTEPGDTVTANAQVKGMIVGEPACRPGSVRPLARGGDHPSGTAVTDSLVRSTREHRAGRPPTLAQGTAVPLLTWLRVGFTEPPQSPAALVVSYTAVSPLPPRGRGGGLFSVALSRGSPRVGVTDHPALWSPDLPHRTERPGATARPTHPRSG